MLAVVPFFHAMGIVVGLRSLMCRSTIATLPSGKLWNAGLVIVAIAAINPDTGIFPPSILEDMSGTEAGIQALSTLDTVFFGGAPLADASGEKLCRVTKLQTIIGSTEALLIPSLVTTSPDEWGYFCWSETAGADMQPAEHDLYELVLQRKILNYQAVFHTLPREATWSTKDLFRQHPTKPLLWRYSGRRDDTIVLSNGEKVNPVLMEKWIESHPEVKGALVVGQERFQTGLLIEPERDGAGAMDHAALVEHIWPTVEQANREVPAHGRVYQNKIAVTSRKKSFVRTPKGSIIRFQTVAMFQNEIAAMYNDGICAGGFDPQSAGDVDLKSSIRDVFFRALDAFHKNTEDGTDICSLDVDSLGIFTLAQALSKTLQRTDITAATIYQNPTVQKLTLALSPCVSKSTVTVAPSVTREEEMGAMVRYYTAGMFRQKRAPAARERPSRHTVLLTGSTGSLGSHVLVKLLQRPDVQRVYCLNRSYDAETRQKHAFERDHGPLVDFNKAEFLQANFSLARFGLENKVYELLLSSVTMFIHSAWSVNFNLPLSTYAATHIAGTRHVVDFAAASVQNSAITFVSSIASVGNWNSVVRGGSAVPESIISLFDRSIPLSQGYGESKHVAGEILAIASYRLGIRTAIVRASQLAGASAQANGAAWNRHEWLPSLVHASKVMKKLPRTLGTMEQLDWVPMDVAGATLVDIATAPASESVHVYHLANPHRTSWSEIYPVIESYYKKTGVEIEIIAYDDWVHELGRIQENVEHVPGLKLLSFYQSLRSGAGITLPRLATEKAEDVSPVLKGARAVGESDVRKWLKQWAF
jgi:thioester reductase-like protein